MALRWINTLLNAHERELKRLQPLVARINALEPECERLSDTDLLNRTGILRARVEQGEDLDWVLPEAFATVREAAKRTLGQRHYDVQLIGGMVLHHGKIAEMRTGEGKTLVATLPVYLNALAGRGVHVVTVNDYLGKTGVRWMGPVYHFLGLSVACVQQEGISYLYDPSYEGDDPYWSRLRPCTRTEAYQADVTYGTNNEFGFDYLRDNMVTDLSQCVQRELAYAIVDEVDNILIDEARTPLIISGAADEATHLYQQFTRLVPRLRADEDFTIDEKHRSIALTETGVTRTERLLGIDNLYDPANYSLTRYLEAALRAQFLHQRDRDYVVRDNEVIIVDEFTGRLMLGRRYSEGLHQAIEAKEGVPIQRETVTLATITFQNYFRLYEKLAGMTGTAATEAEEFYKIYQLDVVVIPTHRPMVRADATDLIYKTEEAKFRAVVDEIKEHHAQGQPVLVGTTSIEKSERLSALLQRHGISHEVLNAKYHEREAAIVAQAGRLGAVTIATNMAGRGVDILLGGNPEGLAIQDARHRGLDPDEDPEQYRALVDQFRAQCAREHDQVVAAGGLHIVGTEKHEARRIDNQLRGRAGRQGDPGSSRFYVSLEDDIIRRFSGDRVKNLMEWAGLQDDVPIEHKMVSKAIENAQVKVESYNFDLRKHLVEFDDVINTQRDVIYTERHKILSGADLRANIVEMVEQELAELAALRLPGREHQEWDLPTFLQEVNAILPLPAGWTEARLGQLSREEVEEQLLDHAYHLYEQREHGLGDDAPVLERLVMLRILDSLWIEHLTLLDEMRRGIGLRAYGQQDPLVAFKREGHAAFQDLRAEIRRGIARTIYHTSLTRAPATAAARPAAVPTGRQATPARPLAPVAAGAQRPGSRPTEATRARRKVGRNDPCPCGSGKKYKFCHGAV